MKYVSISEERRYMRRKLAEVEAERNELRDRLGAYQLAVPALRRMLCVVWQRELERCAATGERVTLHESDDWRELCEVAGVRHWNPNTAIRMEVG
jgi:hypothetical protein